MITMVCPSLVRNQRPGADFRVGAAAESTELALPLAPSSREAIPRPHGRPRRHGRETAPGSAHDEARLGGRRIERPC